MKTLEEKCIDIKQKGDLTNASIGELLKKLVETNNRLKETTEKTEKQSQVLLEQEKKWN